MKNTPFLAAFLLASTHFAAHAQNVGIGISAPLDKLHVTGNVRSNGLLITNSNVIELGVGLTKQADNGKIGYNAFGEPNTLSIIGGGTAADGSDRKVKIFANGGAIFTGNVGIGTSTPHAQLQLANTITNRKIVLYETANNDHQFFGIGINGQTLRYQVDAANASHIFFAGTSTSSSTELMRIQGDGKVGIGTSMPHAQLQLANTITNRKIVLYETANNDHQFFGIGINGGTLRYQVDAADASHIFFAGANASTSNELMRIKGNGGVDIKGFTKLGGDATSPAIKTKVIRSKLDGSNSLTYIYHGISNYSQILSVTVLVKKESGGAIYPEGFNNYYSTLIESTTIRIDINNAGANFLKGAGVQIFITYQDDATDWY